MLGMFGLAVAASFLPAERLWGIDHLAYFPAPVRIAALLAVAAMFVPVIARPLYGGLLRAAGAWSRTGRTGAIACVLAGLGAIVVMHELQSATLLLGDAHLLAKSFSAAERGNDTIIMRSVDAILRKERIAQGTTLLYYGAAQVSEHAFGKSWVSGIRLLNCILGGIFVALVLWMARRARLGDEARLWLVGLALFGASVELFFGYFENYTPLFFIAALQVLASLRVLRGTGRVAWVILAWLAAMWAHVQAILLFPALVYVLLWRFERQDTGRIERHAGRVLVLLLAAGLAAAYAMSPLRRYLLLPGGNAERYGLFDPAHLLDVANVVWLLCPVGIVFAAIEIAARHRHRTAPQVQSHPSRAAMDAWLTRRAEHVLCTMLIVPCLVFLFFFNAEIGVARDWDLFTLLGLGMVPWVLAVVQGTSVLPRTSTAAALALSLVLGIAWIAINASGPRSAARFERILAHETAHVPYALETLANWYRDAGRPRDGMRAMERAVALSGNPRHRALLGIYCAQAGEHDRAIELLSAEVEARPDNLDGWRWLALSLEKKGDDARLEPVLRQAIRATRDPRPFQFMLARVMVRQQRIAEAVLLMQHFDPTGMSANVRDFKTTVLERWGQPQGSRAPAPDSASVDSVRAP
jgi:hypothetical protein